MKLQFRRHRPKPAAHPEKRRVMISLRFVYLATILVLMLSIMGAIYGIYRIVDQTLTTSEEVLRLQQEVADEMFKADDYLIAVELLDAKLRQPEPPDWQQVTNPFQSNRSAVVPPADEQPPNLPNLP